MHEKHIDYMNLSSVWGADRKIDVMPNSDPEGQIFLSTPKNHDRFFFSHTFWFPAFDFNIAVAILNESRWRQRNWKLMICDDLMMSTPNVLMTELCDLLYNQCIDNTCCYSFFIYPMGRISVCKIKFVSTGENRGKPCRVCKKRSLSQSEVITMLNRTE